MLYYKDKIPVHKQRMVAKVAKEHYFGKKKFGTEWNLVKNLSYLIGDSEQVVNALQAAKIHSKVYKSPVWFYYYSYRANKSAMNTTLNLGITFKNILNSNFRLYYLYKSVKYYSTYLLHTCDLVFIASKLLNYQK